MNLYESLMSEVEKGLQGKNVTIPFLLGGLDREIDISKNMMITIGGATGSAKSTFVSEQFILNTLEWYFKQTGTKIKLSIIYFGMERKQYMQTAKWISRFIYMEEGVEISPKKIIGRSKETLTERELELVKRYAERLKEWEKDDTLICFEGSHNPTGISIWLDEFARRHGTVLERPEGTLTHRTYVPNHENHIVLIITDHLGILAPEKVLGVKKQNIDKFSESMRTARDLYGFSPIIVQQLNRSISDVNRLKMGDTLPKLSDFADTSSTSHDSDAVLALFDPWRVLGNDATRDVCGYDLTKLRDKKGKKYYRTIHILKNSCGSDGITIPCAFHPVYGIMKQMPAPAENMQDTDYEKIVNGTYFLY